MSIRCPLAISVLVGTLALASTASAAGLNDYRCRPSAVHPYPVVLAHGRGGRASDMVDIIQTLTATGHCVFGEDYGRINGQGGTGMAHLNQSGGEFGAVVQRVLQATGAPKVNVVGYSEGGMVIDNFLLAKGGADKVHRSVTFAGGHHPYAHIGLAEAPEIGVKLIDGIMFLPNTLQALRDLLPPFTSGIKASDISAAALGLASTVGAKLSPGDAEVAKSQFADDLFDTQYWLGLHGGLSEPKGSFVVVGQTVHSLPTKDSAPNVCYLNMVSPGDFLVGASAGWLDPAPNVVNKMLFSSTDHVQVLGDKTALAWMLVSLQAPCTPAPAPGKPANGGGEEIYTESPDAGAPPPPPAEVGVTAPDGGKDLGPTDDVDEASPEPGIPSSGCGCRTASPVTSTGGGLFALGLVGLAFGRRRRSAPRGPTA